MKQSLALIGDIHGCIDPLRRIVAMALERAENLVFLGDYVNRGDESADVMEFLVAFRRNHPDAIFLRGNHEACFGRFVAGDRSGEFLRMGGAKTLSSYVAEGVEDPIDDYRKLIPGSHVAFLEALRDFYETDELLVTHSPVTSRPVANRFHVSGHFPRLSMRPLIDHRRALLDTGCGTWPGAPLTCMLWPSRDWFQV